jgi:hypothetical protein
MRNVIAAALGAAILALSSVASPAADLQRMNDLGTCLAFSYVNAGLDGKREVPSDLLPGILALKDEFMFEASVNGLDDNAAQTYVVEQLTEQNRVKELKGPDAVKARYQDLCVGVAGSLMKKKAQ